MDGLHDESNWPRDIGIVEREERRWLFWSSYTKQVYTSTVWSGINHRREAQSNVLYLSEVDDDFFSNSGFQEPPVSLPGVLVLGPSSNHGTNSAFSLLRGWNFTISLYRILEHAVGHFPRHCPQDRQTSHVQAIFGQSDLPQSSDLNEVMLMYGGLPQRFKETRPVAKDASEDRYNLQAANIVATLQLVRMVLFAAEGATIEKKCQIAGELLEGFAKVPIAYLKAVSSPLLHQLAGIGSILGSVLEGPLPEISFLQVRAVLLAMADLLANLETGLYCTAGASERLRSHVSRTTPTCKNKDNQL